MRGAPAVPDGVPSLAVRRVLVIASYNEGDAWNDQVVGGIKSVLEEPSQRIDVDFQYLDARRHPEPLHKDLFIRYLHQRVQDDEPELILVADDPAVRLVLKYRGTLLPSVPVVFCGVNDFRGSADYVADDPERRPWMAGVVEPTGVGDTVDLAVELHPNTKHVVTIGESEQADFADEIKARHPALDVRHIPALNLSLAEIARELERLGPGTVVLFTPFGRVGTGRQLSYIQSARFVAQHTRVPVYTINNTVIGYGPIGGKVADPYSQGHTAGLMAMAILSGSAPAALGIERNATINFEFDYNQLRKWHIPEWHLPAGSIIINRPKSFRESHPWLMVALFAFLCIQTGVIGILLLQRKRRQIAEAALRKHSQQLANSNYMLEQFAYITAHDFQEPIRSVMLFSELLHRRSSPDMDVEGRQAVDFVFDNSRRLHAMVRGLLAWVRSVEAPPDSVLWCDANQIWREVTERHRESIEQQRVTIESSNLPSLGVHAHHMRELLNQLLENALQHANTPMLTVAIRSERGERAWKLTLFNSGQPIPEAQQSRVFGVFRRLAPNHAERSQAGVGMGLAICRRIVDFYGGRIWIESGAQQGCAFCFTVPDSPRPRARRPLRGIRPMTFSSSHHAHSDR